MEATKPNMLDKLQQSLGLFFQLFQGVVSGEGESVFVHAYGDWIKYP